MELKFGRRNMKKLVEDYIERTSRLYVKEVESYLIEVETESTTATLKPLKEAMVRRVEAIKRTTS